MFFFRNIFRIGAVFLLFSAVAPALQAAANKGTGLPLPRFVSLRAGEVNLRTGPGVQHPVDWVYHRQNLPLEIIAEYGTWRKIRDWQGTQGWVHQSMVGAKRTFIITGGTRTLRRKGREQKKNSACAKNNPEERHRLFCADLLVLRIVAVL